MVSYQENGEFFQEIKQENFVTHATSIFSKQSFVLSAVKTRIKRFPDDKLALE